MSENKQYTLSKSVAVEGIGLHTGKPVRMEVLVVGEYLLGQFGVIIGIEIACAQICY